MNMKLLFPLVLLFLGVFGSAQISKEKKVDEILMKSGVFEARKMVFIDHLLTPLEQSADSSKIKSIRERLTDEKLLEGLRKPYLEMFTDKEIDDLHRFYTSKTLQKLLSNYELLEQKTNENFDWIYDEISAVVRPGTEGYVAEEPVFVNKPDGFYKVKNYSYQQKLEDLILEEKAAMDFSSVIEAKVGKDDLRSFIIDIKFNPEGTKDFKNLTEKNVGKTIAIVINRKIVMAPVVNDVISQGRLQISGNLSENEVNEFVKSLNLSRK